MSYVEVGEEPLHREWFRNELVRVYRAALDPGVATRPHRHSEDTLYVVQRGGEVRTRAWPGSSEPRVVHARSWQLLTQNWWGLRPALEGSVRLPTGHAFFIPSKKEPVIHCAEASPRNRGPVEMIGIELRAQIPKQALLLDETCCSSVLKLPSLSVLRMRLGAGACSRPMSFVGVVVVLRGRGEIRDGERAAEAGDCWWHRSTTPRVWSNHGNGPFDAVLVTCTG